MTAKDWESELTAADLGDWIGPLTAVMTAARSRRHGDAPRWEAALAALPAVVPSAVDFGPVIALGCAGDLGDAARAHLRRLLERLKPWRKGPFDLFGIALDAEWRCDMKWRRLEPAIAPLTGRRVLDVGCGNGYYLWRMHGAGARLAFGLDPGQLFAAQFQVCKRYLPGAAVTLLPLADDAIPDAVAGFDSVFSLGVLYHRRDPAAHLRQLRKALRPGGQLVLETLVIDDPAETELIPAERYAGMRNVWSVPSLKRVGALLEGAGFDAVRIADVTATTPAEQRVTAWSGRRSLADVLAPGNPSETIEGHPAPRRALVTAERF